MRSFERVGVLILAVTVFGGCLKTRAQLKGDDSFREDDRLESSQSGPEDANLGSSYAVDELKSELTRLNGRIEDLERNRTDDDSAETAAAVQKLETRIIEIEKAQFEILSQLKGLQATLEANPSAIFDQGKSYYAAGKFSDAVKSLNSYLSKKNPTYAEEATFLRGDAYFHLRDYNKAIIDFSKFPENKFKNSKYTPQALYKIALSFEAKGMKTDARAFYQELAESYPKTPEGKAAKKVVARKSKKKQATSKKTKR